jgi:hypothetical protein
MTAKKLMDIIRMTGLDHVSYDRANLTNENFFGQEAHSKYYSVVHIIESYDNLNFNGKEFDMYLIKDENTLLHFTDGNKAMKVIQDFKDGYPKDTYFIERREIKEILRNEKLDNLLT